MKRRRKITPAQQNLVPSGKLYIAGGPDYILISTAGAGFILIL